MILQFINNETKEVHCYFEDPNILKKKYTYSNKKRWLEIIKDPTWINKKIQELQETINQDDYIKITHIRNGYKTEKIRDGHFLQKDFSQWDLPKEEAYKNIFDIAIIKTNYNRLFNYYFDPFFYKNINTHEIDEQEKDKIKNFEQIMENFMQKTKFLITTEKLPPSLSEIFKGENKISDTAPKAYFINSKFNLSQFEAIEKALINPTTLIKGPPGTGKSTTLLNIIISAFLN